MNKKYPTYTKARTNYNKNKPKPKSNNTHKNLNQSHEICKNHSNKNASIFISPLGLGIVCVRPHLGISCNNFISHTIICL